MTVEGTMTKEIEPAILLKEPLQSYGKSIQDVIREKDEKIEELKALVRLLEERGEKNF